MPEIDTASFDCGKATSEVEKLICSDDELSKLDESLNKAYLQALKRTDTKKQIVETQKQWLNNERNACQNAKCIKRAYEARMKEVGWSSSADEYVLVMSKNDCVCRHMLKIYNADIREYGQVKYKYHKEFSWLEWEDNKISIVDTDGVTNDLKAKIAFFDINNDSKDEAIIYSEGSLSNSPTDNYDVFNYGDMAMLNEPVHGRLYYKKCLKGFSSAEGPPPVSIHDFSEDDVKKLPEKVKYSIEAQKERGDECAYLGNGGQRINFLRFKNRFFITFEERSNAEMLAMALGRFYQEGGDPKTSREV